MFAPGGSGDTTVPSGAQGGWMCRRFKFPHFMHSCTHTHTHTHSGISVIKNKLPFVAIWTDFKGIMISKISQTKTNTL